MHIPSHFVGHTLPVPNIRICTFKNMMRIEWLGEAVHRFARGPGGVVCVASAVCVDLSDDEASGENTLEYVYWFQVHGNESNT